MSPRVRHGGDEAKADLHLHTDLGDGMASVDELLDYVEQHTDLDLIAVTEHDQLEAGLLAQEIHARRGSYHFAIIAGAEVTTIEGHLLVLGIERPVASFRPLAVTLDAVHRQGGLCLIPHPMSSLTRSIGRHGIERILARRADGLWFDGIELTNQSPAGRIVAERVQRLNAECFRLPAAGGSDAHYLPVAGTSYTVFHGAGLAGLRTSLEAGITRAECGRMPSLAELGYGQVLRQTWRGLGATPRRMLRAPLARLTGRTR
ncbi:MAG: PHP domain-containing protein [Dehalococcoidia bacterium]